MTDNPFAPPKFGRESSTSPKNSFQKELDKKMQERKKKGLSTALSPSEDDSDALSSDNELLSNFAPPAQSGNKFMKKKSDMKSSPKQERSSGNKKLSLYDNNSLMDSDDDDDGPSDLLATMKKPWQPPANKKFTKSKDSHAIDDVDAIMSRSPKWQSPHMTKTSLEQNDKFTRSKSPRIGDNLNLGLGSLDEDDEDNLLSHRGREPTSGRTNDKFIKGFTGTDKTPRSITPEKKRGITQEKKMAATSETKRSFTPEKKDTFSKTGAAKSPKGSSSKLTDASKPTEKTSKQLLLDSSSSSSEDEVEVKDKNQKRASTIDYLKSDFSEPNVTKKDALESKSSVRGGSSNSKTTRQTKEEKEKKEREAKEKEKKEREAKRKAEKAQKSKNLLGDSDSDSIGEEMGRGKEQLRRGQRVETQNKFGSGKTFGQQSGAMLQNNMMGPQNSMFESQDSWHQGQSRNMFDEGNLSTTMSRKQVTFDRGPGQRQSSALSDSIQGSNDPFRMSNSQTFPPSQMMKDSMNQQRGKRLAHDEKESDNLNSSMCQDYDIDPSPMGKNLTSDEKAAVKHTVKSHTVENRRNDDAINTVKKEQGRAPEKEKKSKSTLKNTAVSHYPRSLTAPSTPTTQADLNSSVGIRDAIYREWYEQRMQSARKEKLDKLKKEKEEEDKKEKEKNLKLLESKKYYAAWLEKKKEVSKGQLQKKKEEEEQEKMKKEAEMKQKRKESKKLFERWKEGKDEKIVEKKQEERVRQKREKEEEAREKQRKKKDAESAFQKWDQNKEEKIKQREEEIRRQKLGKAKEEKQLQLEKEKDAEQRYKDWMHKKEASSMQKTKKNLSFADEDRPQWRPSSKTVPFGR